MGYNYFTIIKNFNILLAVIYNLGKGVLHNCKGKPGANSWQTDYRCCYGPAVKTGMDPDLILMHNDSIERNIWHIGL